MLPLPQALDIVTAALALNRSIIAPAEVVRHGPLWVMRDAAPKPGKARVEEIFAYGAPPAAVLEALREYAPPGNYALEPLLSMGDDPDEIKAVYKAAGFRLGHTEPLFICRLADVPAIPSEWPIRQVTTLEEAKQVGLQVFKKPNRKLRPVDLEEARPAMRMYWVEIDGQAVAAARSLMAQPNATWMHDVLTLPEFRRRGIARALLSHILAEDLRYGAEYGVLLASHTGSKLYPHLGYQQQGLLQIYSPTR